MKKTRTSPHLLPKKPPAKTITKVNWPVFVITGIPGTGKTDVANYLKTKKEFRVIEEKDLIRSKKIGTWDPVSKEYEVSLPELKKHFLLEIKKATHPLLIVGHLSCEFALPVDGIIVLTCPAEILEKRLDKRNYSPLKILDNLYCEETGYCVTRARVHYPKRNILVTDTHSPKKVVRTNVWTWVSKRLSH